MAFALFVIGSIIAAALWYATTYPSCPHCGSHETVYVREIVDGIEYYCLDCQKYNQDR